MRMTPSPSRLPIGKPALATFANTRTACARAASAAALSLDAQSVSSADVAPSSIAALDAAADGAVRMAEKAAITTLSAVRGLGGAQGSAAGLGMRRNVLRAPDKLNRGEPRSARIGIRPIEVSSPVQRRSRLSKEAVK